MIGTGTTLDIDGILNRDDMAVAIVRNHDEWKERQQSHREIKKELRNYVFATDTTTTSNKTLPWKNSTTRPKLCQIRDNLLANYEAALFPHDDWLIWEGDTQEAVTKDKRELIQAYMRTKLRQQNFSTMSRHFLQDFVDEGNVYATTEYVTDVVVDPETGEEKIGYVGPRAVRISPHDIVYNPIATRFEDAPKIIRTIRSLGEIKRDIEHGIDVEVNQKILDQTRENRQKVQSIERSDLDKAEAYNYEGLGNFTEYFASTYVEILTFLGDFYDMEADELYENHIIKVVDRAQVVSMQMNPRTNGTDGIRKSGWRDRPECLVAMGPLDNLIGMQYRIDHLENQKADVFDLMAHPMIIVQGDTEDFDWAPGERIYVGDEGSVQLVHPDPSALTVNNEIMLLEQEMEEMAGAPRQAMGIRTPGEKTAFEVQTLDNASSRIFQNKIKHFSDTFLMPLVNDMLEITRRNFSGRDTAMQVDAQSGVKLFLDITKDDLAISGRLYPTGAAHFAKRNNIVQNLVQLYNTGLMADPSVSSHVSGMKIAKLVEELLDLGRFDLVQENIRVHEQADTQRLLQTLQQQLQAENQTAAGVVEGDLPAGTVIGA